MKADLHLLLESQPLSQFKAKKRKFLADLMGLPVLYKFREQVKTQ